MPISCPVVPDAIAARPLNGRRNGNRIAAALAAALREPAPLRWSPGRSYSLLTNLSDPRTWSSCSIICFVGLPS